MVEKKKFNLLLFCLAVLFAVSLSFAVYLFKPQREENFDVANRSVTVVNATAAKDLLVYADSNKTIANGIQPLPNEYQGLEIHLVIPKNVVTIRTYGANAADVWTGKNITTISFEQGSSFTGIDTGSSNTPWFSGENISLKSIVFPNNGNHQTIGANAFNGNGNAIASTGLQSVQFTTTGGVTIGAGAFQDCKGLRTFDCNVTTTANATASTVGANAFMGSSKLYRAIFPSNLTTISENAFNGCTMLYDAAIGDSVTTIGNQAFKGTGLKHFTIPKNINTIGNNVFEECFNLAEVENHSQKNFDSKFTRALNIYGGANGTGQSWLIRDKDGIVFCKNTRYTSTLLSGVNYKVGNWYVVGYADPVEHQYTTAPSQNTTSVQKLLKFPEKVDNGTQRWNTVYTSPLYYRVVANANGIAAATPVVSEYDEWARDKEYDYIASDGTVVKNTISETVSSYDIGHSAFYAVWAPYVEIPDCVHYVGNNAFQMSHISSIVLGSGIKAVGAQAFNANNTTAFGPTPNSLTVYLPDQSISFQNNSFFNTGWAASSAPLSYVRFIYKTQKGYDDNEGQRPNYYTDVTRPSVVYTYFIDVKFSVYEGTSTEPVAEKTEKKVAGVAYNQSQSVVYPNVWSANSEINALPNVNGMQKKDGTTIGDVYKTTKWYENLNNTSTALSFTQLNSNVLSATGNLSYSARLVNAPVLTSFTKDYDGKEMSLVDALKESTGLDASSDYIVDSSAEYTDSFGNAQAARQSISDAGTYRVSVSLNTVWGEWANAVPQTFTVTVNRIAYQLVNGTADAGGNLEWGITAPESASLRSGDLYRQGNDLFLQPQYEGHVPTYVAQSYARYLAGRKVTVGVKPAENSYFNVESHAGDCTAEEEGTYTARATLKLKDEYANNYYFTGSGTNQAYGVTITIESNIAIVSKIWYIVGVSNWLTPGDDEHPDEDSGEFILTAGNVNTWVYSEQIEFFTPRVLHGEQWDIKFTLSRNGAVLTGANQLPVIDEKNPTGKDSNNFIKYFNSDMPAGNYVLTLNVDSINDGNATYPAIERTYSFVVKEKEIDLSAASAALQGTFEYNYADAPGSLHLWKGRYAALVDKNGRSESQFVALDELLSQPLHNPNRQGVWKNEEYDDLYTNYKLTYNLYRMQNNNYYSEDSEYFEQSNLLKDIGEYTVYYQLSAPSYTSLVNTSGDERRDSYFTVVVYKQLTPPQINDESLVYTGSRVTPIVPVNSDSEFYSVLWNTTENAYLNARTWNEQNKTFDAIQHTVTLRSHNANLYRWDVTDRTTVDHALTFTIKPAGNSWTVAPRITPWNWRSFDQNRNVMTAVPYRGADTVVFAIQKRTGETGWEEIAALKNITIAADGSLSDAIVAQINALDAGNYRLVATVPENANYLGLDDEFTFEIGLAANGWVITPNVVYWEWKAFDKNINKFNSSANFSTVDGVALVPKYSVYKYGTDGAKVKIDDALINFTLTDGVVSSVVESLLKDLDRGTYWLVTNMDGVPNKVAAMQETSVTFDVLQAYNSWSTAPGMTPWQYKGFDQNANFVAGVPLYDNGDATKPVKYAIYLANPNDNASSLDKEFVSLSDTVGGVKIEDYFKNLGLNKASDNYWLVATYEGNNNFRSLRLAIPFSVSRAANVWLELPSVQNHAYRENYSVTGGRATAGSNLKYIFNGNEYTTPDALKAVIDGLGASATAYTVRVVDNNNDDNYQTLAETTITFTVSKAQNSWNTAPSMSATSWTFGSTAGTANAGAAAYETADIKTAQFFNAVQQNGVWQISGQALAQMPTGAGNYAYVVVVAESDNYTRLAETIYFQIGQFANGWDSQHAGSFSWKFGTISDDAKAAFEGMKAKQGTIGFAINGGSETLPVSITADKTDVVSKLNGLGAGVYTVSVSVTGNDDYTGLEKTVSVTVEYLTFTWAAGGSPTGSQWYYETATADKNLAVPQVAQTGATYTFAVNYTGNVSGATTTVPGTINGTNDFVRYFKTEKAAAGIYIVVVTVSADNYRSLTGTFVVTINRTGNSFDEEPTYQSGTTDTVVWIYGAAGNQAIEFGTLYDAADIAVSYTVDGTATNDLAATLAAKSAGTYSIRAQANANNNYASVSKTITLVINKGQNGFDSTKLVAAGWTWTQSKPISEITLSSLEPQQDADVVITVSNGSGVVFTQTMHYEEGNASVLASEINALLGKLAALDATTYTVSVRVEDSDNYSGLSRNLETFTVAPAANSWQSALAISGNLVYGNVTVSASATAEHGTVEIKYFTKAGAEVSDISTANAGDYKVVASVAQTGNYAGLNDVAVEFSIARADDRTLNISITPGWVWDAFDQTRNLFSAVARSGGAVTIEVYTDAARTNKKCNITVDAQGRVTNVADLQALAAGTYYIKLAVAQTTNYNGFDVDGVTGGNDGYTFEVTPATNTWATYPTIEPWAVNDRNFDTHPNRIPRAVARYGDVEIKFVEVATGKLFYHAIYHADTRTTTLVDDCDTLDNTPAGAYQLIATVVDGKNSADELTYRGISQTISVEIYTGSTNRPTNTWAIVPAISDWTAGDTPSTPVAQAVRGNNVEFTYWTIKVVDGKNARDKQLQGAPNDAGEYILYVVSTYGEYTEDILKAEITFRVKERTNTWSITPNIEGWSLGTDAPSIPVADTDIPVDEILYEYKLKDLNDSFYKPYVPGCITDEGTYTMRVTGKAENCADLVACVDFTVTLSRNQWLELPTIQGWSEEFEPNDPTGKAEHGEIVYTYFYADGTPYENGKPKEEGKYIMRASVTALGYAPLTTDDIEFTITAAFDQTLLAIDTGLAAVLCALTVVVIIFAIRRNRQ